MSDNHRLNSVCSNFANLLHPVSLRHLAREWMKEDVPSFDYGGFVVGEKEETAVLLQKTSGVLCGRPFVDAVFQELSCSVNWNYEDGSEIEGVTEVASITGRVRQLLLAERVILNCITRASGVATLARRLCNAAKKCGWTGDVAGTRKTTPGFRLVEKYALLVGGASTHRYDLSSMIMLKDNHIWTAGSITKAVKDARAVGRFSSKIEVECRSLEEGLEATEAGADIVMFDNFSPEALQTASAGLKAKFPGVIVEASGGITEHTLTNYCQPNVDVVSLSKLTQGYETLDFSMKISKSGKDPRNLPVKL